MSLLIKRGEQELISNFIWIILTLIFLALLVLFVNSKSESSSRLEEKYAKQIALLLDNAKPGMQIKLDMFDAYSMAKKEKKSQQEINRQLVTINNNLVTVKVKSEGSGFSYHFFNDVELELNNGNPLPDTFDGRYIFIIKNYR